MDSFVRRNFIIRYLNLEIYIIKMMFNNGENPQQMNWSWSNQNSHYPMTSERSSKSDQNFSFPQATTAMQNPINAVQQTHAQFPSNTAPPLQNSYEIMQQSSQPQGHPKQNYTPQQYSNFPPQKIPRGQQPGVIPGINTNIQPQTPLQVGPSAELGPKTNAMNQPSSFGRAPYGFFGRTEEPIPIPSEPLHKIYKSGSLELVGSQQMRMELDQPTPDQYTPVAANHSGVGMPQSQINEAVRSELNTLEVRSIISSSSIEVTADGQYFLVKCSLSMFYLLRPKS